MEIDKKTCLLCKKKIEDENEYFCKECYEKSLEEAKQSELYQEIQKIDNHEWFIGAILLFGLLNNNDNKGE